MGVHAAPKAKKGSEGSYSTRKRTSLVRRTAANVGRTGSASVPNRARRLLRRRRAGGTKKASGTNARWRALPGGAAPCGRRTQDGRGGRRAAKIPISSLIQNSDKLKLTYPKFR